MSNTREVDLQYLVVDSLISGYQIFSFIIPPAYTGFILARHGTRGFSLNKVLRTTWIGGLGSSASGLMGYARYAYANDELVRQRRLMVERKSASKMVTNDYSITGGFVGSALVTAIFWNRARIVNLVLGGAGIGSSVGLATHFSKTVLPGSNPPPTV